MLSSIGLTKSRNVMAMERAALSGVGLLGVSSAILDDEMGFGSITASFPLLGNVSVNEGLYIFATGAVASLVNDYVQCQVMGLDESKKNLGSAEGVMAMIGLSTLITTTMYYPVVGPDFSSIAMGSAYTAAAVFASSWLSKNILNPVLFNSQSL